MFLAAEVAAAPVYDAQQLLADEHLRARGTFVRGRRSRPRAGDRAGARWRMLSETPGRDRRTSGGTLGADNDAVYGGLLGLDADAPRRAAGRGVI